MLYRSMYIIERSKNINDSYPEINELTLKNNKLQSDLKDWITTAENNMSLVKTLQNKAKQANSEKHDFELLLARINSSIRNPNMQNVIANLIKTQRELHTALEEESRMKESMENSQSGLNLSERQKLSQLTGQCDRLKSQIGTVSIY